ncbi:MAG: beta-propeller domain-containing protein [Planctomycetes bacterium]|nr:beta-propeller domain-containing protein [Planctomycetota bacterium]
MIRYGTLTVVLLFLPGCFYFFPLVDGGNGGDLTGLSTLKRFESEQELTDYFKAEISGRNDQVDFAADFSRSGALAEGLQAAPTGDGGAANVADADAALGGDSITSDDSQGSFSQTTIQEVGVDESDVVKTDGSYVYVIHESMLRIVRVAPRDQFGLVAELALEGYGREMYLHDGKVIALTETYGGFFGFGGGGVPEPLILEDAVASGDAVSVEPTADGLSSSIAPPDYQYERPRTIVTIFDVAAPDNPERLSKTSFVGTQSSSRMIEGVLHLVVTNFQHHFYDVLPLLGRPELDVSAVKSVDILPTFEQVDAEGTVTSGPLVTWENMYRPTDSDGFGVLTVVSMNTNGRAANFSAVGIVAEPGLLYSSTDALYLTDTNWDFFGNARETSDIYKLAYQEDGAVPVATGTVRGRILNQYSMGAYNGFLRVATTVSPEFSPLGQVRERSNSVYVLEASDGKLAVTGKIENIAPGETIQSARFLGDRGYLVTFREIDPLFTLNLADPREPRVVGVLKVPGFSTFMVPMDQDHLLTIGRHIPENGPFFGRGVQLSIFDVSDFADPKLKHLEIIGGSEGEAWSEALNNPKAFTYFAESGLVALPIEVYNYGFFFDDDVVFLDIEDDVVFIDGDGGLIIDADGGVSVDTEPVPPPDSDFVVDEPLFVPQEFRGLAVYRVSTDGGFQSVGRISTEFDDGFYWTAFTRGVFIDDHVFAVTNRGIRGAAVIDMASIIHDIQFEQDRPEFLVDPIFDIGVSVSADEVDRE